MSRKHLISMAGYRFARDRFERPMHRVLAGPFPDIRFERLENGSEGRGHGYAWSDRSGPEVAQSKLDGIEWRHRDGLVTAPGPELPPVPFFQRNSLQRLL